MANQIAKSGPGASPTYHYCSSRYRSNEQNNSAQYGAVVFKLYLALESWRGNCACWNKDSCDLSSDILIQLVHNLTSRYASLLNILGDLDVGVAGLQIKHRGTMEEATSLLHIIVFPFTLTSKKKKKKKNERKTNTHTHNSVTFPYHSGYSAEKHKFLPYPPIFFLKEITIISLGLSWCFLNTVASPVCSLQHHLNKEVKVFSFLPSP